QARQALIQANVGPYSGGGSSKAIVQAIRNAFPSSGGITYHLTGTLPTIVDTQQSSTKSQSQTQDFSLLFILVLLLVSFRAFLAPIVTLLPAGVVLALSGPVIAE